MPALRAAGSELTGRGPKILSPNPIVRELDDADCQHHCQLVAAQIPIDRLSLQAGGVLDTGEETITRSRQLSELGVRFSVSDFGRCWSSRSRLTRLPLHERKMHRTLVLDIDQPATDATLVSAIITLGRSLGLTTVAEGVETEVQRCILAEQGCDTLQGFLFSHPLPLDGFERLLRRGVPNG